jgi:hypothetical protein
MMRRILAAGVMLAGLAVSSPAVSADGGTRVPCEYEDSNGCVWDGRHMGNGAGRSYVAKPDGRVIYVSHARAHYLLTGVQL